MDEILRAYQDWSAGIVHMESQMIRTPLLCLTLQSISWISGSP
jgi:hypothetical protein